MNVDQLISPTVPTLNPADSGSKALSIMEENNLSQMPLVFEDKYLALVQESELLDWETPEAPLSSADFLNYKPAVIASSHPYEAMRVAHQQNLSVVPVVDIENTYLGSITKDDLLKYITENSGVENPGGIIVIELDARDYSLSEIARLCENEDVTIISTQVKTNKLSGKLEITIKTNRNDLHALTSSFERHNLAVKAVYGITNTNDTVMDRYESLMNYLNM